MDYRKNFNPREGDAAKNFYCRLRDPPLALDQGPARLLESPSWRRGECNLSPKDSSMLSRYPQSFSLMNFWYRYTNCAVYIYCECHNFQSSRPLFLLIIITI